jgi:hypothetical protein
MAFLTVVVVGVSGFSTICAKEAERRRKSALVASGRRLGDY